MHDRHGRALRYLRVSVTDRCNLRCVYCMPPEGIPLVPPSEVLRYEEIVRLVRIASASASLASA
jgi:cyclic pyranopterin phosphate synthase